jgi:hypothetical protein
VLSPSEEDLHRLGRGVFCCLVNRKEPILAGKPRTDSNVIQLEGKKLLTIKFNYQYSKIARTCKSFESMNVEQVNRVALSLNLTISIFCEIL